MMDFHAAMETFAEAWVAANTQTAVNTSETQISRMTPLDELPTMLTKEQLQDDSEIDSIAGSPALTPSSATTTPLSPGSSLTTQDMRLSQSPCTQQSQAAADQQLPPPALSPLLIPARPHHHQLPPGFIAGKSLPVHCIVEHGGMRGGEAAVDLDSFAILPSSTLFSEIVRIALVKLGYSTAEAVGAKGAIQIKHWKPLTFDTITENPDATLEDIIGDLTSVATLRIRLSSRSKAGAMEEVKEKLLHFLLQNSHSVLQNAGCPIEKTTLSMISKGEFPPIFPEEMRNAFDSWYKDQVQHKTNGQSCTPTLGDNMSDPSSMPQNLSIRDNVHSILPRTRFRTSFDPDQEIPRLQHWFSQNQHPTREQMMQYLNELNALESRRGRKPLDLTNIIYWFKNQRALQRRKVGSGDEADQSTLLNQSMEMGNDEQDESMDERLSTGSPDHVPVLPNKNAVYMVTPLHSGDGDDATGVVTITEEEMEQFERNGDKSQLPQVVNNNNNNDLEADRKEPINPTDEEDENDDVKDLSMNKSGSGCSLLVEHRVVNGAYMNGGSPERHQNGSIEADRMSYKREREDEYDSGHSNSSSPAPSPTRMTGMNSFQAAHLAHLPPHLQQPLNLASSIQQALNMPPYLHPAHAFYAAGLDGSQLMGHSPHHHHHHLSSSSDDRKKRSRVFIDPLSEIPKLEKWFLEDTHPSSYMIEKYTEDLNRSEYRQRFPRLEPKNVQLWFKNHRAKVKRARLEHCS